MIHRMHRTNDGASWSSCTVVCRKVIMYVKMYRFPYEKFKVGIFGIIIMEKMKIRISILQTTDFDETLSELQSTHSKHILFSDDRNLTDRFFIHLRWRFSIIIFSKFTELIFRKINFENFIGKSIHLYIHNHFTTYFARFSFIWVVHDANPPRKDECKAAHKIFNFQNFTFSLSAVNDWSIIIRIRSLQCWNHEIRIPGRIRALVLSRQLLRDQF